MAHFDPDAQLADHTKRFIEQLIGVCDKVILVTTSGLDPRSQLWAESQAPLTVIERPNEGYDFMSYRTGLEAAALSEATELVVCNDSFVGMTSSLRRIWRTMARKRCDFWGITMNAEIAPHVQSYFMVFRPGVAMSAAFRSFWSNVRVLPTKTDVIHAYEIGLSQHLIAEGFLPAAFFVPSTRETWRALERQRWCWDPNYFPQSLRNQSRLTRAAIDSYRSWNPTILLADHVLRHRLPLLKLQVLREDPAQLGATGLLDKCEARFPDLFSGVRAYVERTTRSTGGPPPARSQQEFFEHVRYR